MKRFLTVAILVPSVLFGQEQMYSLSKGIQFIQSQNWRQILTKAKAENKYIFVDCYATWCGPCKEMDKSVYPDEKVGEYYNDRFISVKAQMDTSMNDDDAIKNRYRDAHFILKKYKPDGYPTFLFFTPDGQILSKSAGLKSADEFIKLGHEVVDPAKNYYLLLEEYRKGNRNLNQMSFLVNTSLSLGDSSLAEQIGKDYIDQLKNEPLLTKENIEFLNAFTKGSKDLGFRTFYEHSDSISRIMGNDTYSQKFVQDIIFREIVKPQMETAEKSIGQTPDWPSIELQIKEKYNNYYSERVITASKTTWALHHKDWPQYTKYLVLFQDRFGSKNNTDLLMSSLSLNNYAWQVFQLSNDTGELNSALSWSARAMLMYPASNWIDTYANILYKLGRKSEAIMWEVVVTKLEPDDKKVQNNLEKMKKDEPTWPKN